jgi:3-isopropylmalate/(R)-2-methylmalate dehydratase small subunit
MKDREKEARRSQVPGRLIKGRVLKFGDNINTDLINPAQYMELSLEEMTKHAMEGADPTFSQKVRPGDIMVAGKNFGSGSSRETAPMVIKASGIVLIIAEFFARIFFRNAINIGLKVMICGQTSEINENDELEVDPSSGIITDLTIGREFSCQPLPDHILDLVNDGGLIPHIEKAIKSQKRVER